jgi:hypothetical protein
MALPHLGCRVYHAGMRMTLILCLALAACSKGNDVLEELPNSSIAGAPRQDVPETRMEAGQMRPVTVGEDGARLDACGAMGQASRVGAKGLTILAAPFADASEVGRMGEGDRAYVCTRSLDQKWFGVVVLPAAARQADNAIGNVAEPTDCGVREPVERKHAYDGPCLSGWVSSASIRLIAG